MDFKPRCSYVIALTFLCAEPIGSASVLGSEPPRYVQSPSPSQTQPKLLFRSRLGDIIEDGVGYGGVRLGMREDVLDKVWGKTLVANNGRGNYRGHAFRLDTGEFIFVQIKDRKVESMAFLITPELIKEPLKTSKDVWLGQPFERVQAIYGDPGREEAYFWFYPSHGIGFSRQTTSVHAIIVFEKGRSVTSSDVIP